MVLSQNISEPVGLSLPKFSSSRESQKFKLQSKLNYNLNCPAQGSPIPVFRYGIIFAKTYLEPIGSSAPKFSSSSEAQKFRVRSSQSYNLNCPAQGSPTPMFRYRFTQFVPFRTCGFLCSKVCIIIWNTVFQSCNKFQL